MKASIILLAILACLSDCSILQAQTSEKKGSQILSNAEGYHFMVGFMQNEINYEQTSSGPFGGCNYSSSTDQLRITIASRFAAHVKISVAGGTSLERNLAPLEVWAFTVDKYYECIGEGVFRKGIEIESSFPINVSCFSSRSTTSDGYQALPIDSWGTEYISANYHLDYYESDPAFPQYYYCDTYPRGGEFAVIAAFDSTVVTVVPKAATSAGMARGSNYVKTLRKGEIFQVQDGGSVKGASDLTGSIITSSKPVGLLSGHVRAAIPYTLSTRNHLIEMLPPRNSFGRRYMIVPFGGHQGGDLVRIIAGESGATTVAVQTDGATYNYTLTGVGEYAQVVLEKSALITASRSVLVTQYCQSMESDPRNVGKPVPAVPFDPYMVVVAPEEEFITAAVFQTLPEGRNANGGKQFDHQYMTIVAEAEKFNTIELNGENLSGNPRLVTGLIPNTTYRWATLELDTNTIHILQGHALFGGYIYGIGTADAYGWPIISGNVDNQNPECTPKITPSGTITICGDDSVQLDAGVHQSYAWSNGATTRSITVKKGGTYSVTTTDSSGCAGVSAPVIVKAVKIAPLRLIAGGQFSLCRGDSTRISLPEGFALYRWSTGDTGSSIDIRTTGTYWAEVQTVEGCTAVSDTVKVIVHDPGTPVITADGSILTSTAGSVYRWYRNGTYIPGATSRSISAIYSGEYIVRITDSNGCSAESAPFMFIGLVVDEDALSIPLRLTYSGTRGNYSLEGMLAGEATVRIELVDIQGRRLMNETHAAYGMYHQRIAIDDVAAGTYFLRLHVGAAVNVWQIVVE